MADNNRNQQFDQSSSGWDQNRRRFDQESDYNRNRENYGSFGNTGTGDEWNRSGQGGYSGASSGMSSQSGRSSMSDYEDRGSNYGSQGWGDRSRGQDTGNMGGYRQSGSDYRTSGGGGSMGGYGSSGMDMGTGMRSGMGNRGSWQDQEWQRSNYGGGYGRDERQGYGGENRGNWDATGNQYRGSQEMGGRSYGEIYGGNLEERERMTNQARGGRENIMSNRSGQDRMYGGMRDEDWRSSGQYGSSSYGRSDYGRGGYSGTSGGYGDWDRSRRMSDYDRGRGDWDRDRRDYDRDRSWWDKTRDEVSSWFGDEDAERRRLQDERRSENYRGKGPRDYKRSDDRIREDVCDRLSDDPFIDASDIEVRVDGSEVILSGRVDSREAKRRAEDMVESISGVSNVQNQLKVTRDTTSNVGSSGTAGSTGSMGSASSTDSTRGV